MKLLFSKVIKTLIEFCRGAEVLKANGGKIIILKGPLATSSISCAVSPAS